MHSPTKNSQPKKTRKNTFSQGTITQNEVGDFQGGYFVMPDATASKENDHPPKTAKNNHKVERSPARRKQSTDNSLSSPNKERIKPEYQACKKVQPHVEQCQKDSQKDTKDALKGELLLTPSSFSIHHVKTQQASPKQAQYFEHPGTYVQKTSPPSSPNKYLLSTSPTSGRWAGPAFGNAPHPSSLPLPDWTESSMSTSPPVHDAGLYHPGIVFQAHPPVFPHSPSQYSTLHEVTPFSSIPVVPFPYVDSVPPAPSTSPSLAQLSIDLRRMLNINGGPMISSDPILVSANSS